MYSRIVDGVEYDFGVSGKLIRNVMVMYDRQTNSLWSQLLGEAVEGELIGLKLEYIPAFQMTWDAWKKLHPDSVALKKGYYGDQDPYANYYLSNQSGVIGETFSDDRLQQKEFVIGVELEDFEVAFPFSVLSRTPLVNYQNKNINILVVFDSNSALGIAFNPIIDGQLLNFDFVDNLTMRDVETNSLWDSINGIAIEGDLIGKSLERIKSTSSFWFGWKDFHPNTLVYSQNP